MIFLFIQLFSLIFSFISAGKCADGSKSVKIDSACQCDFYAEDTCCPLVANIASPRDYPSWPGAASFIGCTSAIHALNTKPATICKPTPGCADLYNLVQCGKDCSPNQAAFTLEAPAKSKICQTFSDNVWNECKDAEFYSLSAGKCVTAASHYNNAQTFANSVLNMQVVADSDSCFNGALSYSISLSFLGVIFFFFSNSPLIFILFISFLALLSPVSATCVDGNNPIAVNHMCACQWYQHSTCCPTLGASKPWEYATDTSCIQFDSVREPYACKSLSQTCQSKLLFGSCAKCAPNARDIMELGISTRVCQGFADQLWDACKDDQMFNTKSNSCQEISSVYSGAQNFVEKEMGWVYTDKNCFNGASTYSIAIIITLIFFFWF